MPIACIQNPSSLCTYNKATIAASIIIAAIATITIIGGAIGGSGTLIGISAPVLFLDLAWILCLVKCEKVQSDTDVFPKEDPKMRILADTDEDGTPYFILQIENMGGPLKFKNNPKFTLEALSDSQYRVKSLENPEDYYSILKDLLNFLSEYNPYLDTHAVETFQKCHNKPGVEDF